MVRGEGYSVPPDWMLSLGQVNGTPMLRIFAPAIVPGYHGYPIPIEPGSTPAETPPPATTAYSDVTPVLRPVDFGISLKVQDPIDTRYPFDREPLLANPESVTPVPCRGPRTEGRARG